MATATARRASNRLLQAGAFVRGRHLDEAAAEVAALAAVLAALRTAGTEHMDMVAFGLEQQLREEERSVVLSLMAPDVDPPVRRAVECALGLDD